MRVLVISDMHVASAMGILYGRRGNVFQKWVFEKWMDEFVPAYQHPDYLILNGDNTEGTAHKDHTQVLQQDVDLQVEEAYKLLKPLAGPNTKVIGTTGSGYHYGKGFGHNGDRMLANKLGGIFMGMQYNLDTPHGIILFTHPSKNIVTEARRIKEIYYSTMRGKVTMKVSSHNHKWKYEEHGNLTLVHTPCWQYYTELQGADAEPIDIGAVQVLIGEKKNSVEKIVYPIPKEIEYEMCNIERLTLDQIRLCEIERKKSEFERAKRSLEMFTAVTQRVGRVTKSKKVKKPKFIAVEKRPLGTITKQKNILKGL